MVKVYGVSDDLVIIEGSHYKEHEIDCYDKKVRIYFTDGTIILVGYPKSCGAIWQIDVEHVGNSKYYFLTICKNEDDEIYSDVFKIDSEIKKHIVIEK